MLFLCIRCVGIHRSLGTHISKARSVDMDNWTLEQIALAQEWGNIRGNAVWEATRGDEEPRPIGPEGMKEFVKQKYVEGRWLRPEDRLRFGFSPKV